MHHQMTRSSPKDASMTGKLLMVLTVLVVDTSTCFGQYGGGETGAVMAEMMSGGMGGLGAMVGGSGVGGLGATMGGSGMGGLGAMMGGGGMGGLGAMMGGGGMSGLGAMMGGGEMGGLGAMMGGGTGGGMGAGIGAMVRQGAMASAMNTINEAVYFIVGPQAKPDELLINYTMSQRAPPRNMMEMLPYLPHMQRIARTTYGSWLATQNTGKGSGAKNATVGTSPAQVQADLDTVVMQRAIDYMNRPQTQRAAAGGAVMAAMGAMIPRIIQGITAQYM